MEKIIYHKNYDPRFKQKVMYEDVGEMRECGVDMRHVIRGAHPDEVELLKRHETEARVIRGLWKQAMAAQRE